MHGLRITEKGLEMDFYLGYDWKETNREEFEKIESLIDDDVKEKVYDYINGLVGGGNSGDIRLNITGNSFWVRYSR